MSKKETADQEISGGMELRVEESWTQGAGHKNQHDPQALLESKEHPHHLHSQHHHHLHSQQHQETEKQESDEKTKRGENMEEGASPAHSSTSQSSNPPDLVPVDDENNKEESENQEDEPSETSDSSSSDFNPLSMDALLQESEAFDSIAMHTLLTSTRDQTLLRTFAVEWGLLHPSTTQSSEEDDTNVSNSNKPTLPSSFILNAPVPYVAEPQSSPIPVAKIQYRSEFDWNMSYFRGMIKTHENFGPRYACMLAQVLRQCAAHYTAWKKRRDLVRDPKRFLMSCFLLYEQDNDEDIVVKELEAEDDEQMREIRKKKKLKQQQLDVFLHIWCPDLYVDTLVPMKKWLARRPEGGKEEPETKEVAEGPTNFLQRQLLNHLLRCPPSLSTRNSSACACYCPWRAVRWELHSTRWYALKNPKNFQVFSHRKEMIIFAASQKSFPIHPDEETEDDDDKNNKGKTEKSHMKKQHKKDDHALCGFFDLEFIDSDEEEEEEDENSEGKDEEREDYGSSDSTSSNEGENNEEGGNFFFPKITKYNRGKITLNDFDDRRLIEAVLEFDNKNYHAWSYRAWLLTFIPDFVGKSKTRFEDELKFTADVMYYDVFNNSAWSHRFFLLRLLNGTHISSGSTSASCFATSLYSHDELADIFYSEIFQFALSKMLQEPNNECPYVYAMGLIEMMTTNCLTPSIPDEGLEKDPSDVEGGKQIAKEEKVLDGTNTFFLSSKNRRKFLHYVSKWQQKKILSRKSRCDAGQALPVAVEILKAEEAEQQEEGEILLSESLAPTVIFSGEKKEKGKRKERGEDRSICLLLSAGNSSCEAWDALLAALLFYLTLFSDIQYHVLPKVSAMSQKLDAVEKEEKEEFEEKQRQEKEKGEEVGGTKKKKERKDQEGKRPSLCGSYYGRQADAAMQLLCHRMTKKIVHSAFYSSATEKRKDCEKGSENNKSEDLAVLLQSVRLEGMRLAMKLATKDVVRCKYWLQEYLELKMLI